MMLLLAAGCRQMEEIEPVVTTGTRTLRAVLESEPDTRTHLGGPDASGIYYPYWSEKEEIAVYVDGIGAPDKYTLTDGSGSVSGVFTGTIYGIDKVALYPYSAKDSEGLQGKVLNLNLPSVQSYKEGTFADGSFPMVAVSDSDELNFKNLCSVLRVSMTGEVAVKSIRFVANDGWMPVSGKATVRTDFVDEPELVMSDDGPNAVTLDCGYVLLDLDKATEFFIVIPPGTYRGGFSIEVKTFKGTVTRSTDADIVFKRSQVRSIPTFECEANGEIDPDDIPYNEIWYTTSSGRVRNVRDDAFDRAIVSNTYADGKGVIVCDGPVTKVGDSVFSSSNLTEVILPNSVESIDRYAFYRSGISVFRTPDNLRSVGEDAFMYCNDLMRIHGSHASSDEKAIVLDDGSMVAYAMGVLDKDLVIPDGVKTISSGLFSGCSQIETITFPDSVESIGYNAFYDCSILRELKGNNQHLADSRSFVNTDGYLALWAGYGAVDYVIPESVTYYDTDTFSNNKTLHSLTFPTAWGAGTCGSGYFYGSDNLEFFYGEGTYEDHHCLTIWGGEFLFAVTNVTPAEYTVPDIPGLGRTNYSLFADNNTLERLTMPDGLPSINAYFCRNAKKLRSVRMPANLSSLGYNAFDGVTTLDTLYFRSFTPPAYDEVYDYAGFGHEGLVICVPRGFEELYKNSSSWSKYADYIQGYVYDDLANPNYYISTDYSRDGEVKQLQKAKKGAGIDLVLMGDAFSDRQIADGTYASVIDKMADAFFSEEPYTTYRDLFNVYSVDVVSASEGYDHPGQALSGYFGDGTLVGGNNSKCMDYARSVVGDDRMDNVLIIVAMNSTRYAGTCYMYYSNVGDYGCGTSVAYFPIGTTDEGLAQLVHHEAGGHGFSKLDDEYAYEDMGTISEDVVQSKTDRAVYGWWKNVDFTNDPEKVKWSKFLGDERYQFDGLGVFEGACTYWKGAWRPTENSIMRYNTGGFNAPSRESIWYRINKLAYGEDWKYDYEEFVAYDAVNRKTAASATAGTYVKASYEPTHPPVVVGKTWREAMAEEQAPRQANMR